MIRLGSRYWYLGLDIVDNYTISLLLKDCTLIESIICPVLDLYWTNIYCMRRH